MLTIPITSAGTGEAIETSPRPLLNPPDTAIIPHALIEDRIINGNDRGFMDGFEGDCPSNRDTASAPGMARAIYNWRPPSRTLATQA